MNAHDRAIPIRYIIPNLFTTMSLCCGLAALHFSIKAYFGHNSPGGVKPIYQENPDLLVTYWDRALASVVLAAIFDSLDGRFARLLRVTSRFGAVLDSLADFVAFGVAPAFMLYLWKLGDQKFVGLAAVVTFALCSAMRLARFTSMIPARGDAGAKPSARAGSFFAGMPTPAAAAAALLPLMIHQSKTIEWEPPAWAVVANTLFIAWLMISRRPMYSFKKLRIRRGKVVPLLVMVGLMVATAVRDPWLMIGALALAYVLTLPLSMWHHHRMATREALDAGITPSGTWSAGPRVREAIERAKDVG